MKHTIPPWAPSLRGQHLQGVGGGEGGAVEALEAWLKKVIIWELEPLESRIPEESEMRGREDRKEEVMAASPNVSA